MDNYLENWIKSVDLIVLKDCIKNRKVYVWGAFNAGNEICKFLEENKIIVEGYIDGHKVDEGYSGKKIWRPGAILDKTTCYVIVAVSGIRKEIKDLFSDYGYVEIEDYVYISAEVPQIGISYINKSYQDIYGNEIIYKGGMLKCSIFLSGYNNKIIIDTGFEDNVRVELYVEDGGEIVIGKYFRTVGNVRLEATKGGKLSIGDSCYIMKDSRLSAQGGSLKIGNYVTMGERGLGICAPHSPIILGDDCMLSHDVTILSTDSHSVFDLSSGENISIKKEKSVKIGNHVWIGKSAIILYNSDIGDGSIVGAGSVVKCECGMNCVLAGNTAKVIREACTWDRRRGIDFKER